jgi:8-amino-7-oxononanoate synthase
MTKLDSFAAARLKKIHNAALLRKLRTVDSPQGARIRLNGREFVNFSSNDYLGLANHPSLKEAAGAAIEQFGAGAGASRLICGSLKPFHELEECLADFKRTEACLTFSTGYAAAVGTIPSLIGKDDIVIIDKLVHACIVDAVRLAGAKLRVFKHNDLDDLERILKWAEEQNRRPNSETRNVLVVTESVFSMDGDRAPLKEIVELKEKHGAWLIVDEAHATGLFGKRRSGLIEHLGLSGQVEIQMGTLGKAVGAAGGFICGSRALIDLLINCARSFIFSTAPVPASAAAAKAGIELIQSDEGQERCARLWERVKQGRAVLQPVFEHVSAREQTGNAGPPSDVTTSSLTSVEAAGRTVDRYALASQEDTLKTCPTPILPLVVGDESDAVDAANALCERGFHIPAIRYPTVARGKARLRMTITADHTAEDLQALGDAWKEIINRLADHKS